MMAKIQLSVKIALSALLTGFREPFNGLVTAELSAPCSGAAAACIPM